jgi:pimeloyl-ACP methyl ester carboxylesterase
MTPSPLPPALDADRIDLGGVCVYAAGRGRPLLLVHSVNAAASAAEVRPLFEHFRAHRRVYAPDLPGYGLSDRGDRAYTPRLMTDALHAVAAHARAECGDAALDALGVSLGCEFVARAAAEDAPRFGRLVLVSPTGLNGTKARRGRPGATRAVPGLHAVLSRGPWADALFRGLTRPGVIRYFLERTWGSRTIDEELWAYDVLATRAPGARHAPLHFLSGGLFSADVEDLYQALRMPVWVAHGTRGDFTDYRGKARFAGRPNWSFSVYEAGALLYFEHREAFLRDCAAFLDSARG